MIERKISVSVDIKKFVILLSIITLCLVILSIAGQVIKYTTGHDRLLGFVPKFFLDEENNVPTFFSSMILLITAFLFFLIAVLKKKEKDPFFKQWSLLALIFLFISIDETASIHELFIDGLRNMFALKGIFYFAWIIPAFILFVLFFLFYIKFFFHLSIRSRWLFSVASIIYVGGGLISESVGGWYSDMFGEQNFTYSIIVTIEESFELTGIIIIIYGLLDYIHHFWNEVSFSIQNSRKTI